MIVSRWDDHEGLYHYYKLKQGAIQIRVAPVKRLTFHDIELHAKGDAVENGTGDDPRGVIVMSVQEQAPQSDNDSCVETVLAVAALGSLAWVMG